MKTLFILSLFQQGYKIKVSTLYHLLKGKRTVSVLMNGFLFDNLSYFHLFPELNEQTFQQLLQKLLKNGLISFDQESLEAQITGKGTQYLLENAEIIRTHTKHLNGYSYAKTENDMWRMLQFLVQVTSHLSYQNKQYIPLEASPYYQLKIKQLLVTLDKNRVGHVMIEEWRTVLSQFPEKEGNFIAQQFSGYRLNGKAEQQLLQESSAFHRLLYQKNIYHQLFSCIERLPQGAVLYETIKSDLEKNKNQSMLQTKELWLAGHSLSEITQLRQMKLSTVNDHFLELAISEKDFLGEPFIPQEQLNIFQEIKTPCQTWQYAELRQRFEIDYFAFRMYQIMQIKKERE